MTEILIFILIGVAIAIPLSIVQKRNRSEILQNRGIDLTQNIETGKFICGHPAIDIPLDKTFILDNKDALDIYRDAISPNSFLEFASIPAKITEINKNSIEDITIEDASTIEKRVTVTRLALTGLFAFALKKKQKNELMYVVIKWKDGKFKHDTIFEFEGQGAIERANRSRNKLIKSLN